MIHALYLLPFGVGMLAIGHYLGTTGRDRSLTLGPDHRGVTGAHCIRGRFYYLVPERVYNGLVQDHYHLRNLGKARSDYST